MSADSAANVRAFAPGIILSLLSIVFGFLLGGSFGAAEGSIKAHLRSSADAVLESVYQSDASARDAVVSKSWVYMKRAHLHGGAIGAASLASILLLVSLGGSGPVERVSAAAFGAGSLIYSSFWLAAGLTAPSVGSTGAAKEALGFLAIPGAAFCIIGIVGIMFSVVRQLFARPADSA